MVYLNNKKFLIAGQLKTSRTETLEDYLQKRVNLLGVIGFMSPFASYNEAHASLYENGKKIREFSLPSFNIKKTYCWNRPLICASFLIYIFSTFVSVLKFRRKFDYFVGIAAFSAMMGLILRKIGCVKKVIYYCIDYYPPPKYFSFNSAVNFVYKHIDILLVKNADVVWEISERIKEGRRRFAGVSSNPDKTIIVPLGYANNIYRNCPLEKRERWTLGFIGTLSENQGLQMVIEATAQLVNKFPEIKVRVIGSGPFSEKLKRLIKKFGVIEQFIFHGFIQDDNKVYDILSRCMAGLAVWTGDKEDNSLYADPGKPKLYGLLGLPIIITESVFVSKLIKETQAGEVIRYSVDDFIAAVERIIGSEENYKKYLAGLTQFRPYCLAENIFDKAFLETFHIDNVSKKVIQSFWTKNVPGWDNFSKKYSPQEKEFYEAVDSFRFKYEPYVLPLVDSFASKNANILEIGCGLGTDSRYIAKCGLDITSLDLSFNNVSLTMKGMCLFGLKGKGICADAEKLPFKDNSYEVVYSFGVLHHTPNTEETINEIYRVLKPCGKAFIMLYHKGYAYYFIKVRSLFSFRYWFKSEEKLISDLYDQTPLSKMYSRKDILRLFKKFKDINTEITTFGGIQNNKKFKWIYVILGKFPFLMKRFGTFMIIKAVK